jgi:hypothetical protein
LRRLQRPGLHAPHDGPKQFTAAAADVVSLVRAGQGLDRSWYNAVTRL